MPCANSISKKQLEEDKVFQIFKRDEILELVKLKKENSKKYRDMLKNIAEVLKDIAEIVDEVNKKW